ncbi:PEP-CTERM sorting domain-containing protein [Pseudomaricurvus alkylphenolicus]|uniref:PEP-CTERM sorting domain-containing protein n=1 Tax=Pseudomaricurvus alkylphenolicus TaxID=1306991 RepID=UPI001423FB42|nr:PEP-CTERM sorting domain-containing protein [Pseudomaricurvus alkylphenolicus]NIB40364.1 PEP-CTERM sorting domain-containing protein [Pseudomaricurvus alkylphenolicus]
MQLPKLLIQMSVLFTLVAMSLSVNAQELDAKVTQDPAAGLAIYDFHFQGPPRNSPYFFLPHISPPPLPGSLIPWTGIFQDPVGGNPIFSFNFQLQSTSIGEFILSDGAPPPTGQPNIAPGVTCLLPTACDPIAFMLPMRFQPLPLEDPEPFPVFIDVELTPLQTNIAESGAGIGLGIVGQPPLPIDPFADPLLVDPLLNDPGLLLPLPLDPLGIAPVQIPLPPDPNLQGIELSLQALVLDPFQGFAPVLTFDNLQSGQNIQIGNSLHIETSAVPVPATLSLMMLALAGMIFVRRRQLE